MEKGIAVQYHNVAPKILSTATGTLLKNMLEIAAEHGIPVFKDKDLAELLYNLPAGSDVPQELFKAVAEVFAFCYRVNDSFKNKILPDYS